MFAYLSLNISISSITDRCDSSSSSCSSTDISSVSANINILPGAAVFHIDYH